jgi:hypothetical protein
MLELVASNGVRTIIVETANRFARDLIVQETGPRAWLADVLARIADPLKPGRPSPQCQSGLHHRHPSDAQRGAPQPSPITKRAAKAPTTMLQ